MKLADMQLQRIEALLTTGWRPHPFTLLLIFLSLLGAGLALALHGDRGVLLDWDSVNYISVADSLLAGAGFRQFNGLLYTDWPPLYPLLLAALGWVGLDPYLWAGGLNALAFALTIFLAGQWLRRRLTSRGLLLLGCMAIAVAYPLTRQAAFALTETIFILFTLLALLAAERFLHTERRSALLWAALFTALACLTRYLGLTLVVAIALLLALHAGVPLRQRAQRIALYAILSLAPLGLWMLRNYLLLGTPTGRRSYDVLTFSETLGQTLGALSDWTAGSALAAGMAWPWLAAALNWLPAVGFLIVAAALIYGISAAVRGGGPTRLDLRPLYVFGLFALVYLIMFNAVAPWATFATNLSRYILPAWLPLLLTALIALDRLGQYIKEWGTDESRRLLDALYRRRFWLRGALFLAFILWLGWQVFLNGQQIVRAWDGRPDIYSVWAEDETLRYLRETVRPDSWEWVLSNLPAATYIFGGRSQQQAELPYNIPDLLQWMAAGDLGPATIYVVWLYGSPDEHYYGYDHQDLWDLPTAETLAEFDSGVLLRLRRAAEPGLSYRINLHGNRVFYRKSPCFPSDANPVFSLQIYPAEGQNLPADRQEYGFVGEDFRLEDFGRREQGRCYMERELPAYPIREIRTGQYRIAADGAAVNIWQDGFRRETLREPLRPARPRRWSRFGN